MGKGCFVLLKAQMYNLRYTYMGSNFFFVFSIIIFFPSAKATQQKGKFALVFPTSIWLWGNPFRISLLSPPDGD